MTTSPPTCLRRADELTAEETTITTTNAARDLPATAGPTAAALPYPLLVDGRTGIVRRLVARPVPPWFPPSFTLTHAWLCDPTRFGRWPADATGAGHGFAAPGRAVAAALGEAAERYCGNLVPPGLVTASHAKLVNAGIEALDPDTLALYSPDQYDRPGFPLLPMTADLVQRWAPGRDLSSGQPVLVPASLVWVSWNAPAARHDVPHTHPVIQAGLAAGADQTSAETGALLEVIERDAMTLSWSGGRGVHQVVTPQWLRDFCQGPRGALDVRLLAFDDEFAEPVLGALVTDAQTGYLTLGMGVHHDPIDATLKAYGEALQLQLFVADYDDPAGSYARLAASPASPLKPWRADRRYAQSYRGDLGDVVDYGCHLQLHLDPAVRATFHRELTAATVGETRLADLATRPAATPRERLAALVDRLAAHGHRAVAVDVTTPDVRRAGLYVTRVVVPGLYSNSPAGLPFLGGQRLPAGRSRPRTAVLPTMPLPH
ncbi:YcaO-like family protein [Frankia sp. AgB1.9]|uniref:YcaO-like family protein n=1 Tax=unclassified Frankia TaxID=2632575 RepID=UPI001932C95E|nr:MULTISPECIES: YcaO-like family protein [unclassified Frankia]MBL7493702.1 YcaO-like family protein [Frankia sp. AgW1.1]MBL7553013.1 YcaO-like family protein [Frankia sp. AgB1.9]MBL7621595.1 YcaO-like family protein [Frankia sp. AgB1.8]